MKPWGIWCIPIILLAAVVSHAQVSDLKLTVDTADMGLFGLMRPGEWMPIRATVENNAAEVRHLRLQWVMPDVDGDQMLAQRSVSIPAQDRMAVWLYGVPRHGRAKYDWRINLVDDDTGELLSSEPITLPEGQVVPNYERVIAMTEHRPLGLQSYQSRFDSNRRHNLGLVTQQEAVRLIRFVDPRDLPDRWYGLSVLHSFIWTPDAGDPGALSPDAARALRQWVRRGGHLVIVLKPYGDLWSTSQLGGLIPAVGTQTVTDQRLPAWMGADQAIRTDMRVFEPRGDTTTVLRDEQDRAIVVAGAYGFGRVTLVGIDLTSAGLVRAGVPRHPDFWGKIYNWQTELHEDRLIESMLERQTWTASNRPSYSDYGVTWLERYFGRWLGTSSVAASGLGLAMGVFSVYWLLAGPISFAVLRRKGRTQHAWTCFVLITMAFTLIAWGGAYAMRPVREHIRHITVLDVDASGQEQIVHARSWLSIFVPTHGDVRVEVGDEADRKGNIFHTIAAPGLPSEGSEAGFLESRRYVVDAGAPAVAPLPFRSTTKQIEVDYLGTVTDVQAVAQDWIFPQGQVRVTERGLEGRLSHGLPGKLTNCLLVYYDGTQRDPFVWVGLLEPGWSPGEIIDLSRTQERRSDGADARLALVAPRLGARYQGLLNRWVGSSAGADPQQEQMQHFAAQQEQELQINVGRFMETINLLTFYDALPPPDFRNTERFASRGEYERRFARAMDLSSRVRLRRLYVIGVLEQDMADLPVPLTVDGRRVPATGMTLVRWSTPLAPIGEGE